MPVFCTRPFCGIVFDEEINLKEHIIKVHKVMIPLTKQLNLVPKDEKPKKKVVQIQPESLNNPRIIKYDNKNHLLNEGQKFFVNTILDAADSNENETRANNVYALEAYGGTGKTFCIGTICAELRG